MKNVLYYFSATGNTERAVGIVAEALKAAGQEARVEPIRKGRPPALSPLDSDRILVAFPALAMIPPVFVQAFIKGLPRGRRADGTRVLAAVLCADGGGCGPAPLVAARLLRRRGYSVALTGRAGYAENWTQVTAAPKDAADAAAKTEAGDAMARDFARKLVGEVAEDYKPGPVYMVLGGFFALVFPPFGRRFLGKVYFAGPSCDACGLCARTCPAGTIVLAKGKRAKPFWRMNCEACNRCINLCPKKAIDSSTPRIALLIALITAGCVAGVLAFEALAWPAIGPALPAWSRGIALFLIDTAIVVLAHFFVIGPMDAFFLRFAQRIPPVARLFALGFTRKTRRYLAPGFKPRAEAR